MRLRTGLLMAELFKKYPRWKKLDDKNLTKLKEILLMISDDVMTICEQHGIKCIMAYGTALGSVRHKGFIPWDDDMDFYMLRKDYMKFLEVFPKTMGDKYIVRSVSRGDALGVSTCHVRLKGTHYVNYGDMVLTSNEPEADRGIYVDIFPLDDSSDNKFCRNLRGIYCLALQFVTSCVHVKDSVVFLEKEGVEITKEEKKQLGLKYMIGRLFGFRSVSEWSKKYDQVTSAISNPHSKYVTCYTGYKSLKKSTFLREDILPCNKLDFEGRAWNSVNHPEKYLAQEYNDYMSIPDKDHQKIHPILELDFGKYLYQQSPLKKVDLK